MPQLKNDRLLKAIWREPVDMTPVWFMRQAGRYLPEYRRTRKRAGSFETLCKTPELACEVTLQPLLRCPLDAAILFSDILTIPDAMGLGLKFIEGSGPNLTHPVRDEVAINRLKVPDLACLNYVYDTIKLVQRELAQKVPLIGFCGSPWTLAAYMIEGKSVPGFPLAIKMQRENGPLLHKLLDILAKSVTAHLNAQITAGVQVVMLFDTWGGLLNEAQDYEAFSLNYIKQIIKGLNRNYNNVRIPIILFTKGGSRYLNLLADSGCDVVGLDWQISLKDAREQVGSKVALQGNMNPTCLSGSIKALHKAALDIIDSYGHGSGHIFNLGHGITPEVPPEHVALLVDAVHEFSKPYHVAGVFEN